MQEKQIKINWNSKWARQPRWLKRGNGFVCYFMLMFVSLWNPELADMALFKTLSEQFYYKDE
jgi:hypothetical protein